MVCTKNNNREPSTAEALISSSNSALGDALLLATMCIIGLPVEVQVKDGSVYSGIFHTARADKDYAIVLKKARKIRRGRCDANLEVGALIDTLVVLSSDLVQVVAKDILLPGEGINGNGPTHVIEGIGGSIGSTGWDNAMEENTKACNSGKTSNAVNFCQNEEERSNARSKDITRKDLDVREVHIKSSLEVENRNLDTVNSEGKGASCATACHSITERQKVEDRSQEEVVSTVHAEGIVSETIGDTVQLKQLSDVQISLEDTIHPLEKSLDEREEITSKVENGASLDSRATAFVKLEDRDGELSTKACLSASDFEPSTNSASAHPALYIPCSTSSLSLVSPNILPVSAKFSIDGTNPKVSPKGFKLNPGAKTFLPSYARSPCATPMPAPSTTLNVASAPFIPGNATFMPIGGMQPAVEISPLVSHQSVPTKFIVYNNHAAANYVGAQHPRPVAAHCGTRSLLARPNSQQYLPVQVGAGYLHPNSQNAMTDRMVQHLYMQTIPQDSIQLALPELAPPPPLSRPLLTPYQFNLPKIQPAPAFQLCAAPPVIAGQPQLYPPFAHPLHAVQTIPVPGGNGAYGSKFYP